MKAIVWFGGGAYIGLHVGYAQGALKNVNEDANYGVSAGSLMSVLRSTKTQAEILAIIGTIKQTSDVFCGKNVFDDVGNAVGRRWDSIPFMGMKYDPLRAILHAQIKGAFLKPTTIGRVNLDTGDLQHVTALSDGTFKTDDDSLGAVANLPDFLDAVLCSCLIYPLVDAFLDKNNHGWIDGGFREGGPVTKAILDGATELWLCLTGPFSQDCGFTGNGNDPLSGITRLLELMANQNVVNQVNIALRSGLPVHILDAVPVGASTNFNQKDLQQNILIGQSYAARDGVAPIT